jgi:tetraacyldisaccharide 4'-kinase
MAGLESRLNAIWYKGKSVPWPLRLLERLYRFLLSWRAPMAGDALASPVVVVGNFTVGGTGKTPLISALVKYLQQAGYNPGVVSRGYGRRTRTAQSVSALSVPEDVGDEPLLIAKRTLAPVRVDVDRRAAAEFLIAFGCRIIVSDDGLQHRRLPRQVELEVLDAERLYGNSRLLPAGPLRELPRAVDLRVCHGAGNDDSSAYGMRLALTDAVNMQTGECRPLTSFIGDNFSAVAGIGNPERFFSALSALGLVFKARPFADHHPYRAEDMPAGTVLMTEKDAVKCSAFASKDMWAVPAEAQLSAAFYDALDTKLSNAGVHRD